MFKKINIFILVLVMLISVAACESGNNIKTPPINGNGNNIIGDTNTVMIKKGSTEYKIVIPEADNISETHAANELTYFFEKASGIVLETILDSEITQLDTDSKFISLGNTLLLKQTNINLQAGQLGYDGYKIKTIGNCVFISGYKGNGTIFGVYRFLEVMFGYRYYAKDEFKINQTDSCNLKDIDITEVPTFPSRNIDTYALYNNFEYLTRMRLTPAMGRKTEYFSGGWSSLNDQSMADQILPYEKYKDREGWFSGDLREGQLNITKAYYDEEMFNEFTNNLINNFIAVETESRYFMLGINDHSKNYRLNPHIEDYDKYKESGVMVRFVNKVAQKVQHWVDENCPEREVIIVFFAYLYSVEPPVVLNKTTNKYEPIDESVICNDNVMVRIAPLHSHNMYPHLNSKVNPIAEMAFNGWGAVAKNIAVWDYGTNFSAYLAPYPDWVTLKENFIMYKEKGVQDILTQLPAHTEGTSLHDFKIFIRSELMWNIDADYDTLQREFFENYYKDASVHMQRYYNYLVVKFQEKISMYDGYIYYKPVYSSSYWQYEEIYQLEKLLKDALNALSGLKETNLELYEKVKNRIVTETLFYRFIILENFTSSYTKKEVENMINQFESDALSAGMIAISNQTYFTSTRTDAGLVKNVVSKWREALNK